MARFSVYRKPGTDGYLLDVQANILDHLNTRVVVPLLPSSVAPTPATGLNPVFNVAGEPMVMVTQFMAAVPISLLKLPESNLELFRNEITAALDLLFQGFQSAPLRSTPARLRFPITTTPRERRP